jgi:hypothetical protein
VASQAILSSASVWQKTLPCLLDMIISMYPLAFLLLGIQIICSGAGEHVVFSLFLYFFLQQPCSNSFGYSSVIQLAPLSAINMVVEEKSASGNNLSLTFLDK